ncbi:hypothetical protein ACFL1X_13905 [Candidatus Hydrogenedentota bacterium]
MKKLSLSSFPRSPLLVIPAISWRESRGICAFFLILLDSRQLIAGMTEWEE